MQRKVSINVSQRLRRAHHLWLFFFALLSLITLGGSRARAQDTTEKTDEQTKQQSTESTNVPTSTTTTTTPSDSAPASPPADTPQTTSNSSSQSGADNTSVKKETATVPDHGVTAPTTVKHDTADICTDHSNGGIWIDRLQTNLYRLTCASASWFDGLFGNLHYDEDYRATHGSLATGTLWSQHDGFQKILRFHARVYLTQAQQSLHAFIGRGDREEFVTDAQPQSELYGLPRAFDRNLEDSTLLGLGYNQPLKKRGSFDADAGVRLDLPLDPFVKGSYRFARPLNSRNIIRLRETIFWEHSAGLGTTATMTLDHVIADALFLRTSLSGTYSQITEGLQWYSNVTLYQVIGEKRAFAYDVTANGATDHEIPLADYGFTTIYRQTIWRPWLILELRAGVDWPRDLTAEPRRADFNCGLAFELRFGREQPNVLQPIQ